MIQDENSSSRNQALVVCLHHRSHPTMVAERTWFQWFEHPHYRQRAETGEHGHYLGSGNRCLDWKEGTLKHRGIHCSQRPHLSSQFAAPESYTPLTRLGCVVYLSPPRGGWSSCSRKGEKPTSQPANWLYVFINKLTCSLPRKHSSAGQAWVRESSTQAANRRELRAGAELRTNRGSH